MTPSHSQRPTAFAALLFLATACLLPNLDRQLHASRETLGLKTRPELRQAPPLLALVTALGGGLRGIAANALWIRAIHLQDQGRFFELFTLASWITQLQPEFEQVWAVQSWNMAWNVSRQFPDPKDRWPWIRSAIEILRDDGLRYNPQSPLIHRELAWIYHDKIGKYTDPAHRNYKILWSAEMNQILAGVTNLAALVQPQTDDLRRRADTLKRTYKLDPAQMLQIDHDYGPLDWRAPEAHAVYWASLGLQHCNPDQLLPLRRLLWQSLLASFLHGRLIEYPALGFLDFGPNLNLIPNLHKTFESMLGAEPNARATIQRAHRNFLKDAVCQLYSHSRRADSARWFQTAQSLYPESFPAGVSLDEFVVAEITGALSTATPSRVRGILEGILAHALRCQAIGEDDEANGHALLARQIYLSYSARFAAQTNVSLPPLRDLESSVRTRLSQPPSASP